MQEQNAQYLSFYLSDVTEHYCNGKALLTYVQKQQLFSLSTQYFATRLEQIGLRDLRIAPLLCHCISDALKGFTAKMATFI